MISVRTFCAKTLIKRQPDARIAPEIVTARHPYLFTNSDEIGPSGQLKS